MNIPVEKNGFIVINKSKSLNNLIRKIFILPLRPLRKTMNYIESILLKKNVQIPFAPIFIIGPPRSGTTLIYQIMTKALHLCYFNNLLKYFPCCPILTSLITQHFGANRGSKNYSSYYGETTGWSNPYQGYLIWLRWFPSDPSYIGSGFHNSVLKQEIRSTVAHMENIFNVPFVNKWPVNSVRILPFAEAFPNGVFIRVKRDPVMIAQSILHGRREYWNDEGRWISAKPSNYEEIIQKTNIEQVCDQVYYIEKDIERDSEIVGVEKFLDIEYNELCASPKNVINKIKDFYNQRSNGYLLSDRHNPPNKFDHQKNIKVSYEEYKLIEKYINQRYQ